MRTRDKLAAALRIQAEHSSPEKAAKYRRFAERAATGEFDDFATPSDPAHFCPIMQLFTELSAAGLDRFAKRVASGEFDATKEESDEWVRSPAGQEAIKQLTPAMRRAMGFDGDLLN